MYYRSTIELYLKSKMVILKIKEMQIVILRCRKKKNNLKWKL